MKKAIKDFYEKHHFKINFIGVIIIPLLVALITTIPSCNIANKANEISNAALKEAQKSNDMANNSNKIAEEANKISQNIADVTNRPYVLFEDVLFQYENRREGIMSGQKQVVLPISGKFTLFNNGTLPAWILNYEIYVSGNNRAIKALFSPADKPTKNFTIGKEKKDARNTTFFLAQKESQAGDVSSFEAINNKMILLFAKYKTIGANYANETFVYWELFFFRDKMKVEKMECGTNEITSEDIHQLFEKQNKRLETVS
ncbi:MAG: hypothetical protein WC527_09105 [Candidatus Margulisiibacteriota bacterium]